MQHNEDSRRSFLKHVLAGSALVAGTALTGKQAKARGQKEVNRPQEMLYRETEDFRKYYESLR